MQDIILIDDFVPKIIQNQLEEIACRNGYINYLFLRDPVYFDSKLSADFRKNDTNIVDKRAFVFSHDLLLKNIKSKFYSDFECIPDKIKKDFNMLPDLNRIKLNLSTPLPDTKDKYGLPHPDCQTSGSMIAIYYITDSDGDTILFNEFYKDDFDTTKKSIYKTISPKKGRLVLFDGHRYHANSWPTKKERIILNINYIPF
jgi:hypothetical protein